MTEREYTGPDGRTWIVRARPAARKDEEATHVAVELESGGERRVVTCTREEWESGELDLVSLLARSVPGGAGRGLGPAAADSAGGAPEPEEWL